MRSPSYPPKVYRGSRKRLHRISVRDNSSLVFWLFVVAILLTSFVIVHRIVQHPPKDHDPTVKITR